MRITSKKQLRVGQMYWKAYFLGNDSHIVKIQIIGFYGTKKIVITKYDDYGNVFATGQSINPDVFLDECGGKPWNMNALFDNEVQAKSYIETSLKDAAFMKAYNGILERIGVLKNNINDNSRCTLTELRAIVAKKNYLIVEQASTMHTQSLLLTNAEKKYNEIKTTLRQAQKSHEEARNNWLNTKEELSNLNDAIVKLVAGKATIKSNEETMKAAIVDLTKGMDSKESLKVLEDYLNMRLSEEIQIDNSISIASLESRECLLETLTNTRQDIKIVEEEIEKLEKEKLSDDLKKYNPYEIFNFISIEGGCLGCGCTVCLCSGLRSRSRSNLIKKGNTESMKTPQDTIVTEVVTPASIITECKGLVKEISDSKIEDIAYKLQQLARQRAKGGYNFISFQSSTDSIERRFETTKEIFIQALVVAFGEKGYEETEQEFMVHWIK